MRFALFYEIPVAKPWTKDSDHVAYKNTLEQALAGEEFGWDAFWTVEHHFLDEYSHCSNPEVLYGAIASRTKRMRLGYGVRLMPKPYNHPVRTAESVAVLDLLSDGRVVARGLVAFESRDIPGLLGRTTGDLREELGEGYDREVVHRDDLVLVRKRPR